MRKIEVKEHPRKTQHGRTTVVKHKRTVGHAKNSKHPKTGARKQFLRRKVNFEKASYKDINEIHQDYVNDADYRHPIPGTTNPKGADMEMVLDLSNDSREHHRIFDEGSRWKIESHIDKYSPTKRPGKHFTEDVIKPDINPKLRDRNFDDTQIIYLGKE